MASADDLFDFPCSFPIKVMGLAAEDIRGCVMAVLSQHGLAPQDVTHRVSGGGKYISVTAVIQASSREQLEAIYLDLRQDARVRYML